MDFCTAHEHPPANKLRYCFMRTYLAIVIVTISIAAWAADQPVAAPRLLNAQDLPVQVERAALQRQYDALRAMRLRAIEYSHRGPVHYVKGDTGVILPPDVANLEVGDAGTKFLPLFKDILLASGSETLKVTESEARPSSTRRLMFSQSIRGIPVLHGIVGVEYNESTNHVTDFIASFIPDRGLPREPKISAARAEQIVAEALALAKDDRADEIEVIQETYLGYYEVYGESSAPYLVWVVEVGSKGVHERFFVDAISGIVVDSQPTSHSLTTKVYNANNGSPALPNHQLPAMTSAQIFADPWAYEAWVDVTDADLYLRQRLPLSTSKFPTKTHQIVRYGMSIPSAMHQIFNGEDYIWYAPPSIYTNSATEAPDNTYHEYAHG